MPARNKDKNKTGGNLCGLEENVIVSPTSFEMGYEARKASSPFPGNPGVGRKHVCSPEQITEEEADADLILTYLAFYQLLERALLRAGLGHQATTNRYGLIGTAGRHIEKQFDPLSSEELGMSVAYLLDLREDMEQLFRRQNYLQWESASPYSNLLDVWNKC